MSVTIIATDAVTQDVTNTTTETSIFAPTITANTIGSSDCVVCEILVDYLQNLTTSAELRLRIKFGGTTYYQDDLAIGATSASRHPVYMYIVLSGNNSTSTQTLGGFITVGTAGGATTGLGDFNVDEIDSMTPILNDGVAIDQTADRTFDVTVQFILNTSTLESFRAHFRSLTAFKV